MNINNFGRTSFVNWTEAELRQERQEMTEQELLAVLDMSEDEQDKWCEENVDMQFGESLAELAFRLRDETKSKVEFHHCFAKVCKHIDPHIMNYAGYGLCTCKPIHWIIAALIAKGKAK